MRVRGFYGCFVNVMNGDMMNRLALWTVRAPSSMCALHCLCHTPDS